MLSSQYLIYLFIIQNGYCLSLFNGRSSSEIFQYNGDKTPSELSSLEESSPTESYHSSNVYYPPTSSNTGSSSALIDFMRTLYEQEKFSRIQSDYNVVRALAPRIVQIDNVTMYVFDLNVIRRTETIHSVSLHFYKRRTRWPISYALNEIYSSHRLSSLSAQIQLESNAYGWQSFPIGDLIQRQLSYISPSKLSEYFGLTFKPIVTTRNQRRQIIDLERFSVHSPFMIVYSNDSKETNVFEEFIPNHFEEELEASEKEINQTKRTRRDLDDRFSALDSEILPTTWNQTLSNAEMEKCAVKPLVVDFSDLGFSSWLIEPKTYSANLCSGQCEKKSMTNHALVQYFLQRLDVRNDIDFPEACCVPQRYSSLMIFYKSSEFHYLIRRLPKMIVEECHCR